jgi:hypothetical protein
VNLFDNSPGVHRSTNITFICDVNAGRGQPEPCEAKDFTVIFLLSMAFV